MKETHKEAVLSALVGGVLVVLYLAIANFLDRFMSINQSNMIGLVIDFLLNLIAQQYVFYGEVKFHKELLWRFFVGNSITMVGTQVIFVYGKKYYDELFEKVKHYIHPKYKLSIWRYLSNVLTFFLLTFPLRKYYIFSKFKK